MALVQTGYTTVDDALYGFGFGGYGYGAVVPAFPGGVLNNASYIPRSMAVYRAPAHAAVPASYGRALRPSNDRLDKLVQVALVKIDDSVDQIRQLIGVCHLVKEKMLSTETGGSVELREALKAANHEIYRLRNLLLKEGGAGDLEDYGAVEEEEKEEVNEEAYEEEEDIQGESEYQTQSEQREQQSTPQFSDHKGNGHGYSFFGLMVADGIRFSNDLGGKHDYNALKVVKVWGPSASAGIKQYDLITHVRGQQVATLGEFNSVVAKVQPNESVPVNVDRNGKKLTFIVRTANTDVQPGTITHLNTVTANLESHVAGPGDNTAQIRITTRKEVGTRKKDSDDQTLHL